MTPADHQAASARGRAATLLAGALAIVAVALLATALARGPGDASRASVAPGRAVQGESSNRVYVAQTGCDDARPPEVARNPSTPWCSLDRALRAAPAQAEVLVGPGRYPTLRLDGRQTPYQQVAFRARSRRDRPLLRGVWLNSVAGISFSGFLFEGGAAFLNSGDMRVTDNGFAAAGIYVKSSHRVAIVGNRVRGVRGETRGLLAQGSADPSARANEDLLVDRNVFEDIQHDAIAVYNSNRRVRLTNNVISRIREPPNFRFHSDAMQLMGGEDALVSGNVISDVTHGILVKDGVKSTGLRIEGNLVARSSGAALQVFNAPEARVRRNTFWRTRFGLILANVPSIEGRTRIVLEHNVIDQLLIQAPGAVASARNNIFGRGKLVGRKARRGRPAFVNAAAGDYRIRLRRGVRPPGAQLRVR